ncbi:MAG: hypothetical protein GIW95_06275 [Candidatus Eremiobacteraeota bacterium]|nr:hypothetical protein [Candidatus Eremiobacteraeota bacterium]
MAFGPNGAYARAAALGAVSGLRSMTPAAALGLRGGAAVAVSLGVAALGELAGDKHPKAPSRLTAPSLAFRALMGGVAGALIAKRLDARPEIGFALGAVAALGASVAGYSVRMMAPTRTGLPAPVVALVEDAIAVGAAMALTHTNGKTKGHDHDHDH